MTQSFPSGMQRSHGDFSACHCSNCREASSFIASRIERYARRPDYRCLIGMEATLQARAERRFTYIDEPNGERSLGVIRQKGHSRQIRERIPVTDANRIRGLLHCRTIDVMKEACRAARAHEEKQLNADQLRLTEDSESDPPVWLAQRELLERAQVILSTLDPPYRSVLELQIRGLREAHIACALGITRHQVKGRLRTARGQICRHLAKTAAVAA